MKEGSENGPCSWCGMSARTICGEPHEGLKPHFLPTNVQLFFSRKTGLIVPKIVQGGLRSGLKTPITILRVIL